MKQPRLIILRTKLDNLRSQSRKLYFRCLGLKLGKDVQLGKIHCLWPANVKIGDRAIIQNGVDFILGRPNSGSCEIEIGERVFIGRGCEFNCVSRISIGRDSMIASNTTIVDSGHEFSEHIPMNQQAVTIGEIIIGEDVWIGTGCKILKSVTIGRGSIIGAGSLVNKSIPENQIWAGTPAKFIKNRF